MASQNYKQLTSVITWLVAVGALVAYFAYKPEQLAVILSTPPSLILLLCGLVILTWFTVYIQSYISIRSIATPPPFFEYMGVFCIGLLINYSPIRIGIAARALYLSRFHEIKLAVFSAISIFRLLVLLFMSGLIASAAIAIFGIDLHIGSELAVLLVFLFCLVLPIAVFLSIKLNLWRHMPHNIGNWLTNFGRSFSQANNKPRLILTLSLLIFIQFLLVALRMKICFSYADLDLSFLALMVVAPLGTILSVLAITPGGIGIREFAVASVCSILGYSFEQGMQALIIDRVSMVSVAILLGTGSLSLVNPFKATTGQDDS